MNIKPLHPDFYRPTKGTERAGAYDLYMPTGGVVFHAEATAVKVPLGFAAEVPAGHVALLLPRSGKGVNQGLALNNTCGVIDEDYRGEWVAALRVNNTEPFRWAAGDRVIQMVIVPVASVDFSIVDELGTTDRGEGGLGSTGV